MASSELVVDTSLRTTVIEAVLQKLSEHYVYPDGAEAMEQAVRRRIAHGEYEAVTTGKGLAEQLMNDLQVASHDKHLMVVFNAESRPIADETKPTEEEREAWRQTCMFDNFGIYSVERLRGNIGYLDLRMFAAPEWVGDSLVCAMNLLANTSALMIDLRHNIGGHAATVVLVASYLLDAGVELSRIHHRERNRTAHPRVAHYVPGKRYGAEKPLYILTSQITFSAAESLAYDLQQLQRAIIVGESTGGGAHLAQGFQIHEHFLVGIPTNRAVSPITGTNWEGTGVTPDIGVPQAQAFSTAYKRALKDVITMGKELTTGPYPVITEEAQAALADLEREQMQG